MLSRKAKEHPSRGLAVDIISSIDDDAMVDIVLLSNDGGEIPASRFILGARSLILRQMLFNTNDMHNKHELKINHSTPVVRALVHYCRTNELDDIRLPTNEDSIRELVKLCQCAAELELSGLESLVGNLASSICQVDPHLASTFYDEAACGAGGKQQVDSMKSVAMGFIRRNPEAALLRKKQPRGNHFFGGISSLQAQSLQQILSDDEICCEEITLFRAIVLWAEVVTSKHYQKMDAWATQILIHDRREAAKPIVAKCIDLSKIAPSDLLGIVTESGLVEEADISNALIQIALRVETEGIPLSKRRSDDVQVMPRPISPPPPPPPQQQISYCLEEGADSVADIFEDLTVDHTNASSFTYAPVEQSNKRRANRQQPTSITPPRKPEPTFTTPERQLPSSNSPPLLPPRDGAPSVARSSAKKKKKKSTGKSTNIREKNTIGERIKKAVGMYLRDKVDTMCIHPKNGDGEEEDEYEVQVVP